MEINQKSLAQIFENTNEQKSSKHYKNQTSSMIVSDVSDSERFSFETANECEIKDLKNLGIKKSSGDTIPPKLVKLLADFLIPLLTKAINTSIARNVFLEKTKTASVILLDKGKSNKNTMSNFIPVSVLNTFSKV